MIVLAASFWGTISIVTQAIYGMSDTNPLSLNLMRALIAAPLLWVMCIGTMGRDALRFPAASRKWLLLVGVVSTIDQAFYLAGVLYAGSTITSLVTVATAPIMVGILSALVLKEPMTRTTMLVIPIAVVGVILLVGSGTGSSATNVPLGIAFAFASGVCYAIVILLGRKLSGSVHPLQTSAINFTIGILMGLILTQFTDRRLDFPPTAWLLLLYMGLVPTAIGYTLFMTGITTTPAAVASILVLIDPLVATVFSVMLFAERFTLVSAAGAALLIGAIVALARQQRDDG